MAEGEAPTGGQIPGKTIRNVSDPTSLFQKCIKSLEPEAVRAKQLKKRNASKPGARSAATLRCCDAQYDSS